VNERRRRNVGKKGQEIVDLNVAELVADLRRAYADEWLAAYAYTHMGQVVTGRPAAKQLSALLLDTAKDELEHQQELAERIVSLGSKPPSQAPGLVEASNEGYPTPQGRWGRAGGDRGLPKTGAEDPREGPDHLPVGCPHPQRGSRARG
jgi:Ferritin-like domain